MTLPLPLTCGFVMTIFRHNDTTSRQITMFDKIKSFFRCGEPDEPARFTIEGVPPAPLTPEPDDAELAAKAVLEIMATPKPNETHKTHESNEPHETHSPNKPQPPMTAAHYQTIAQRIREAHVVATQRATRFVAFCEQKLQEPGLPREGKNSLALLNVELLKRVDVIEREGGELKRRWQHCLAEVTIRLMADEHEAREAG